MPPKIGTEQDKGKDAPEKELKPSVLERKASKVAKRAAEKQSHDERKLKRDGEERKSLVDKGKATMRKMPDKYKGMIKGKAEGPKIKSTGPKHRGYDMEDEAYGI